MIILASASPRRVALLAQVGIHAVQRPPVVDEAPIAGEHPQDMVVRLAGQKAESITLHPGEDAVIVAADTVVIAFAGDQERTLGKPANEDENREMLMLLSNASHRVITGYCVGYDGRFRTGYVVTEVTFRELEYREIEAYVQSKEGIDKAGGYAIQGVAAGFVKRIEGSYSNVVGLPLCELVEELRQISMFQWP